MEPAASSQPQGICHVVCVLVEPVNYIASEKKRGKLGRGNGEKSIRFFLCVIQLFSIKRLLLILVYWSVGGRLCVA